MVGNRSAADPWSPSPRLKKKLAPNLARPVVCSLLNLSATVYGIVDLPVPAIPFSQKILGLVGDDKDEDGGGDVGHLVTWHVSHLLPFIRADEETWDSFRLVEAVHLLEAYSLVAVNGSGDAMSITMHPLTHAWARDRQGVKQQQQSWLAHNGMHDCRVW